MHNPTNILKSFITATLLAAPMSTFAVDYIWTGAVDTNYATAGNWSPAPSGDRPELNIAGNTATIGGTSVYDPGVDLVVNNGNTLTIVSGGSWEQINGVAWIQLMGGNLDVQSGGGFNTGTAGQINGFGTINVGGSFTGGTVIANGGTLSVTGGNYSATTTNLENSSLNVSGGGYSSTTSVLLGTSLTVSNGTVDLGGYSRNSSTSLSVSGGTLAVTGDFIHDVTNNGSLTLSNSGTFEVGNEFKPIEDFVMSGGILTVGNLISFADGSGGIEFSGGQINLDGSTFFSGFYPGVNGLNFTTGSTGLLRFENYTSAELTTDSFLNNGMITANGSVDASAFTVTESGGGVNVSLIPEPGTLALSLVAIGTLFWFRRRS